jgi:predicted acetyltransferase
VDPFLVEPSEQLESEFRAFLDELARASESFGSEIARRDFTAYLQMVRAESLGLGLTPGDVPMSTFWLINSSGRLLGESRLRHRLTAALEDYGGHIGYVIRPTERRKGYGSVILPLTLKRAESLGLRRIRLTCDTDNRPSARIIERTGGVLSGYGLSPVNGKITSQYWIELRVQTPHILDLGGQSPHS